jgi:hypothetical protein
MAINNPYSYDTETAEYKSEVPNRITLIRDIAAFANTKGGQIFIGYIPAEEGTLKHPGLTDEQVHDAIDKVKGVLRFLHPEPILEIRIDTTVENKQFLVVTVQKHPTPVLFSERYYVRRENKTTLAEEDLIDALSETVPSIKPNILNSAEKSLKAQYPDLVIEWNPETKSFTQVFEETIEEKPNLNLNTLLTESIKRTRDDLTSQRKERLQQARITFMVALVVLVLAILLVFVGVILIFTNQIQAGVVSSVASIVSGIVSGLALAFNKQTNDRLDEQGRELVALEKSYTGMQYISFITDIKLRDEAIHELAKSISLGNQTS